MITVSRMTISLFLTTQNTDREMPSRPLARISNNPLPIGAEFLNEFRDTQEIGENPSWQCQRFRLDLLVIERDRPCHN